jgi:hypothetical protein
VKSVTLDKFKPQWIDTLSKVGNKVANSYYEYGLPRDFVRPTHGYRNRAGESRMGKFIRDKYELKLFAHHGDSPHSLAAIGCEPVLCTLQNPQKKEKIETCPPDKKTTKQCDPPTHRIDVCGSSCDIPEQVDLLDISDSSSSSLVSQVSPLVLSEGSQAEVSTLSASKLDILLNPGTEGPWSVQADDLGLAEALDQNAGISIEFSQASGKEASGRETEILCLQSQLSHLYAQSLMQARPDRFAAFGAVSFGICGNTPSMFPAISPEVRQDAFPHFIQSDDHQRQQSVRVEPEESLCKVEGDLESLESLMGEEAYAHLMKGIFESLSKPTRGARLHAGQQNFEHFALSC